MTDAPVTPASIRTGAPVAPLTVVDHPLVQH